MLRMGLSIITFTLLVLALTSTVEGQATRPSQNTRITASATATAASAGSTAASGAGTGAVVSTSPAPASPPATEEAWPKVIEQFAKALVESDRPTVEGNLTARCAIRRFGALQNDEPSRLVSRFTRSTLVGQHAYMHPPLVMAADLAADFKNVTVVPDKEKSRFLIDDETEMKRANATAVQWVVEQLEARQGVPIGVVILWTPRSALVFDSAPSAFDVLFVLCRGEETAPGQYKLSSIVYGHPLGEQGN